MSETGKRSYEYNLRPRKRRRLNNGKSSENESTSRNRFKRKNPIMHMPTEVLQYIFQYISFHELSSTVRLVNRRFKCIAENSLNTSFKQIEQKLKTLKEKIGLLLYTANEESQIKKYSKSLSIVEVLQFHYRHIFSTVYRYVFNEFYKVPNPSCIYAGLIIDRIERVVLSLHNYLDGHLRCSSYEMAKIFELTKHFCNHFDRVIEEATPQCIFYSGCKIVDILDSAPYALKTVIREQHTSKYFTAQYSYSFHNSWFIALPIPINTVLSPQHNQRLMHMRLRRIVLAHTEMYHRQKVFERELEMHVNTFAPSNCVYTGYGDVENLFYYYGVMNNASYFSKFPNEDVEEDNNENEQNNNNQIFYRINHLGFTITVIVYCPLVCAPINYLKSQKIVVDQKLSKNKLKQFNKEITLITDCPGAYYPQLPSKYKFTFQSRL